MKVTQMLRVVLVYSSALPEDVSNPLEELLLLLVAVRVHSSADDVEQWLHQAQHEGTACLPGHENLNEVQHLQQPDERW